MIPSPDQLLRFPDLTGAMLGVVEWYAVAVAVSLGFLWLAAVVRSRWP